jgi:hypothetical protein
VVNVHERLGNGLPARSRIRVVPPVMMTLYCVLARSVALGLIVSTLVVALYVTATAMSAPVEARTIRTLPAAANPVMGSLNVTVVLLFRSTPMAPEAGVVEVMTGRGPDVNVHVLVAIVLPARSRTPETVTV